MPGRQDVVLYENPMYGMSAPVARRNPPVNFKKVGSAAKKAILGGVRVEDLIGAIGGFAAAVWVPALVIKDESTEWKKAAKVALSLGIAVVLKGVGDAVRPGMGKAMLYGGFAGTGAMALKIYAPTQNFMTPRGAVPQMVARPVAMPAGSFSGNVSGGRMGAQDPIQPQAL